MNHRFIRYAVLGGALAIAFTANTSAHHAWRKYHWARTTTMVVIDVGDNLSASWKPFLDEAINDWNESVVVKLQKVAGSSNAVSCGPTSGQIEACNSAYGENGWLGIAQIWITSGSHIYQGVTKLNDTYFNKPTYNSDAWRRLVTCQEIAHDFGLDHQDERFTNANKGSCMDYTNDPDGGAGGASSTDPSNEHPNAHDFEQLLTIYGHKDSTNTAGAATPSSRAARPEAAEWGRLVRTSPGNRVQVYEKPLGNGNLLITHVFWANEQEDAKGHQH